MPFLLCLSNPRDTLKLHRNHFSNQYTVGISAWCYSSSILDKDKNRSFQILAQEYPIRLDRMCLVWYCMVWNGIVALCIPHSRHHESARISKSRQCFVVSLGIIHLLSSMILVIHHQLQYTRVPRQGREKCWSSRKRASHNLTQTRKHCYLLTTILP